MLPFDIVMVTTAHPALDVRIFHREAKTLVEAGLRVCVVGRNKRSEEVNGVWVEALPQSRDRLRRLLLGWRALRTALKVGGRLFIFHDPELFWVALLLRVSGHKVVYDCHENLPVQVLQKDWIPRRLRRAMVPAVWAAEWLGSRLTSGVIVARDAILKRFPKDRTVLVRNFPTKSAMQQLQGGVPVESRPNVVIYAGVLSRVRGISELVRAFESPQLVDAELFLVGEFNDQGFKNEILGSLPRNVHWFGQRSYDEVLKLYKSAKVGALLLYPTPSHRYSLPVKLFEYLGAGLPVVASSFPEFSDLVEGCGIQVDPQDVSQVTNALQKILLAGAEELSRMSAIARNRVQERLRWEPEGRRLVTFCSALIAEP